MAKRRIVIPRGCLVLYREWYGASAPNVGLKLTAEEVAAGIVKRETHPGDDGKPVRESVAHGVLDPAAFAQDGGPSIAERMARAGAVFRPADNRRVGRAGAMGGWDQVRARLKGDLDGNPMLVVFSTCVDTIRTLPALQHDPDRPEDLDTEAEDHCFTADTLVTTDKGLYSFAELLGTSGRVLSSDGQWHCYRNPRRVAVAKPIVRLGFSDGSAVRCTPDHKFLTPRGWVEARDLLGSSVIRSRSSKGSATTAAAGTSSAKASGFTGRFGKRITALCREAFTFITGTTTRRITKSKTCSALRASTTLAITGTSAPTRAGRDLTAFGMHLVHGMAALLDWRGTESISPRASRQCFTWRGTSRAETAGRIQFATAAASSAQTSASPHGGAPQGWMTKLELAPSAALDSLPTAIRSSGHARKRAGASRAPAPELVCLSLSDAGRADVYCLTVPDTGNFTLANGAVVANCGDQMRYACMSRPYTRPTPLPAEPIIDPSKQVAIADLVRDFSRKRSVVRRI